MLFSLVTVHIDQMCICTTCITAACFLIALYSDAKADLAIVL